MNPRFAKRLAVACAFVLLAGPAPDKIRKGMPPVPGKQLPDPDLPTRLTLGIGEGSFGSNYSAIMNGTSLEYRANFFDPIARKDVETSKTITPTPEQWRDFWKSMDEIGLWRWQQRYDNYQVLHGTFWNVEAAHAGRTLLSQGHMHYPGQQTRTKPGEYPFGPLFEKYLDAVSKLLGGETFR